MGRPPPRAPLAALAVALVLGLGCAAAGAQTWFDALVASVDGEPILASDVTLDDVLFGQGRTFATMTPQVREEVVTRLIRRRMLLSEAERFGVARPSAKAVEDEVARVRARLGARADGIPPVALEARVREKLRADAFVDARIRAFVLIRDAQVEAAVAKRLARPGAPDAADPGARAELERQVRQELARQETAQRLERYITRLEERTVIRRYPVPDLDF
jgi:hypothetical protein